MSSQVILASPSLGTGVDIQARFDCVFGIFEGTVNTHYDIDQQIYRVRNADEISVWVDVRKFDKEENWKIIKEMMLKDNNKTRELVEYSVQDVNETWFDMLLNEAAPRQDISFIPR